MAVSLAEAEAAYLPTRVQTADYPNLIEGSGEMQTVATGMVLSPPRTRTIREPRSRIARFVDTLFPRFAELQASDRHPKWREVNLTATLPGLSRTPEAESWLAQRPTMTAKPIAASAGVVAKAAAATELGHEPRSEGGTVQEIHRMAAELGEPNAHLFADEGTEGGISQFM